MNYNGLYYVQKYKILTQNENLMIDIHLHYIQNVFPHIIRNRPMSVTKTSRLMIFREMAVDFPSIRINSAVNRLIKLVLLCD